MLAACSIQLPKYELGKSHSMPVSLASEPLQRTDDIARSDGTEIFQRRASKQASKHAVAIAHRLQKLVLHRGWHSISSLTFVRVSYPSVRDVEALKLFL